METPLIKSMGNFWTKSRSFNRKNNIKQFILTPNLKKNQNYELFQRKNHESKTPIVIAMSKSKRKNQKTIFSKRQV